MVNEKEPCQVCRDLDIYEIFRLRPTPSDLRRSGERGCQGCRLVWEGFREFYPLLDPENPQSVLTADDQVTLKIESSPEHGKGLHLIPVVSANVSERLSQSLHRIEFYLIEDWAERPWSQVWPANHICGNTASDISFQAVQSWLATCSQTHKCCDDATDPQLPKRVIDISETGMPKLCEGQGETGRYVCLSYCWGQSLNTTTQRSTLEDQKRGIPWSSLPKTFQDAIDFTRRLGVRFIWIDALCIIQDDKDDWEVEAAQMKNIYSNSYLTVAASSSADSREGCYKVSPLSSVKSYEFTYMDAQGVPHSIFVRWQTHHGLIGKFEEPRFYAEFHANWPLRKRAWGFQERLLSSRVVYFAPHELMWECNDSDLCECSRYGFVWSFESVIKRIFQGLVAHEKDPVKLMAQWWSLVKQYTQLELSHAEDKLTALAGIAEKFHPRFQANTWQKYRAPTWSWASVDGAVIGPPFKRTTSDVVDVKNLSMTFDPIGFRKDAFQFLEGKIAPLSGNQYGSLQAAYLTIKARLASAEMHYFNPIDSKNEPWYCFVIGRDPGQRLTDGFHADYAFFEPGSHHVPSGHPVHFLQLSYMGAKDEESQYQMLVLIQSKTALNLYERIGLISEDVSSKLTEPWFENLKESIITIV